MLQSKLFTKTQRSAPKDEVSKNAQLLGRAGYIDKLHAGVYTYLPLGLKVLKNIETIIREEMNRVGGQEISMPALQPKEPWEQTGRWNTLDVLYKVVDAAKREYALGPTHEEVVVPLAKSFILSYKDLPVVLYQFQTKFRMELRSKSGILRGREFLMKDMYSFHADTDDLKRFYTTMQGVYTTIFERVGIGAQTYRTFASGGSFSKYSDEFQTVTPSGEDTIHLCEKCRVAINNEIVAEQKTCPKCGNAKLEELRAIEVGNIFELGTKYSTPFNLQFKDADGAEKIVVMGCYGIGLGRVMGAVVEVLADDRGLVWPASIAPYAVHLVGIFGSADDGKTRKRAHASYEQLTHTGITVLYDDREASAGEKFADADLLGMPVRLVISEKTGEKIEWKERTNEKIELLTVEGVIERIKK